MTRARVYLRLGRVSNLPTVWTNTLAGIVLAGGRLAPHTFALLALAMSSFYVGGMFLNDAFDREIDARERPERPIPSGQISAREVFAIGYGLLGAGALLAFTAGGLRAALPSLALAGAIVLYDAWHEGNTLSPLIMGLCRMLVYVTAAFATTSEVRADLWKGALVLLSYLVGLTYVAKQENLTEVKNLWPLAFLAAPFFWAGSVETGAVAGAFLALLAWSVRNVWLLHERRPGNIPKAVVGLIAGISLVDALAIAKAGRPLLEVAAASGFLLTLFFQRYVKGT